MAGGRRLFAPAWTRSFAARRVVSESRCVCSAFNHRQFGEIYFPKITMIDDSPSGVNCSTLVDSHFVLIDTGQPRPSKWFSEVSLDTEMSSPPPLDRAIRQRGVRHWTPPVVGCSAHFGEGITAKPSWPPLSSWCGKSSQIAREVVKFPPLRHRRRPFSGLINCSRSLITTRLCVVVYKSKFKFHAGAQNWLQWL